MALLIRLESGADRTSDSQSGVLSWSSLSLSCPSLSLSLEIPSPIIASLAPVGDSSLAISCASSSDSNAEPCLIYVHESFTLLYGQITWSLIANQFWGSMTKAVMYVQSQDVSLLLNIKFHTRSPRRLIIITIILIQQSFYSWRKMVPVILIFSSKE